jgi:hypothetical protein
MELPVLRREDLEVAEPELAARAIRKSSTIKILWPR